MGTGRRLRSGRVSSSATRVRVPRPPHGHSTLLTKLDRLIRRIKIEVAGGG